MANPDPDKKKSKRHSFTSKLFKSLSSSNSLNSSLNDSPTRTKRKLTGARLSKVNRSSWGNGSKEVPLFKVDSERSPDQPPSPNNDILTHDSNILETSSQITESSDPVPLNATKLTPNENHIKTSLEPNGAVLMALTSRGFSIHPHLAESVNQASITGSANEIGSSTEISDHNIDESGFFLSFMSAFRSAEKKFILPEIQKIHGSENTSPGGGSSLHEIHSSNHHAKGSPVIILKQTPSNEGIPSGGASGSGKESSTFVSKLETLLKPTKARSKHLLVDHEDKISASPESEIIGDSDLNGTSASPEEDNLAKIHFESIRESPLQTLGNGNLSLTAFDQKSLPEGRKRDEDEHQENDKEKDEDGLDEHNSKQATGDLKRMHSPMLSARLSLQGGNYLAVEEGEGSRKRALSPDVSFRGRRASGGSKYNRALLQDANGSSQNGQIHDSGDELVDPDVPANGEIRYANRKRDEAFHARFREIPRKERLIDDFLCAILKDILIQGRIYVSQKHICFDLNILGFVTNVVIPLPEVIQIEKKTTAVLFPNGMVIRTLHHKYVFATMINRDSIFSLITEVWHRSLRVGSLSSSGLRSRLQSVMLNGNFSYDDVAAEGDDDDDDDDKFDGEDEAIDDEDADSESGLDDDDNGLINDGGDGDRDRNNEGDDEESSDLENLKKNFKKKKSEELSSSGTYGGLPLVGPSSHEPTSNGYTKESNDTFICEETIPAPVGVVYNLLFGEDTAKYAQVLKDGKNFDITDDTITALSTSSKERKYAYTKPLGGPIGPKQTRCHLTDTLISFDPESVIVVEQVSRTPDVPSGGSFLVKTKLYFSWGASNTTTMYVVTCIEWTGKLWIKGAIEKGSIDGQKELMKTMVLSLSRMISEGKESGDDQKRGRGKSVSKRKRRNTIKAEAPPPPPPPPEPKTILGEAGSLLQTVGESLPVSVPFLSDQIVGGLALFIGYLLAMQILGMVKSLVGSIGSTNSIVLSDGPFSRVKVNGEMYTILQPARSVISNRHTQMDTQKAMWQWIRDREGLGREVGPNSSSHVESLKVQSGDLNDMIELLQLKLADIQQELV